MDMKFGVFDETADGEQPVYVGYCSEGFHTVDENGEKPEVKAGYDYMYADTENGDGEPVRLYAEVYTGDLGHTSYGRLARRDDEICVYYDLREAIQVQAIENGIDVDRLKFCRG